MLDFRRVLKNREIQPEAAFCPTKNQGLEWMNSNPRMQIAQKWNKKTLSAWRRGLLLLTYLQRNRQRIALGAHHHAPFATGLRTALHARDLRDIAQT